MLGEVCQQNTTQCVKYKDNVKETSDKLTQASGNQVL